jgi:hypothetical protein
VAGLLRPTRNQSTQGPPGTKILPGSILHVMPPRLIYQIRPTFLLRSRFRIQGPPTKNWPRNGGRAGFRLPWDPLLVRRPLGRLSNRPVPPSRRSRASSSVHGSPPRFGGCEARRCAFEVVRPGLAARKAPDESAQAGMHLTPFDMNPQVARLTNL